MCGDKWANVFCQILLPISQDGAARALQASAMTKPSGLPASTWRRGKLTRESHFVCLLSRLRRNGGQASRYERSRRCLGHGGRSPGGLTAGWPRGFWSGWAQTEPGGPRGGTCSADSYTHPLLLFSWRSSLAPTATHVIGYKWVLIIRLGIFIFFPPFHKPLLLIAICSFCPMGTGSSLWFCSSLVVIKSISCSLGQKGLF